MSVLVGHNAVEYRFLAVATGTFTFSNTVGGAFFAALFRAVLAARLHPGVAMTVDYLAAFTVLSPWRMACMAVASVLVLFSGRNHGPRTEVAVGRWKRPNTDP